MFKMTMYELWYMNRGICSSIEVVDLAVNKGNTDKLYVRHYRAGQYMNVIESSRDLATG